MSVDPDSLAHEISRILVIDDNPAIHEDICKILNVPNDENEEFLALESELFGPLTTNEQAPSTFAIDSAHQGEQGLQCVIEAFDAGFPYCVAFVDMRMPPGWDGLETIEHLWRVDQDLQIVLCTAYSDYSWSDIQRRLGTNDRLLILKKPFDNVEVSQFAHALSHKWALNRERKRKLRNLDALVRDRTQELSDANIRLQQEMILRDTLENELRIAYKLEAIGQLAAGIAHEINSPIQYTGDSVYFLQEAFDDLITLVDTYQNFRSTAFDNPETLQAIEAAEHKAELDYLKPEIPNAIQRALHGISRVADIVRAVREFAQPEFVHNRLKQLVNINRALQNTMVVARHEYRFVANVEVELGEIPEIPCFLGDINQVFLSLLLYSAHSIADHPKREDNKRGTLYIQTHQRNDEVVITIANTEPTLSLEMPPNTLEFLDPPLTQTSTRRPGNGLTTAETVVNKHGGRLTYHGKPDTGITFFVRLPIHGTERSL